MLKSLIALFALCCASALVAGDSSCDTLTEFCTPSQVIGCLRSIKFTDSYFKEALDDIVKSLEPYVFLDILKNPPQPEGLSDYFTPVDLVEELKKVKTEGTNFYDFYRDVQGILARAQDGHFGFSFTGNEKFNNKLTDFLVVLPISLYADTNSSLEPVMKGVPLSGISDVYDSFPNGPEIKEIIQKNADVPIVSINGQSPFDYVLSLGKYHIAPKNKNAKYTLMSSLMNSMLVVYFLPMDVEDFSNVTVVYENGESFTTDFYFGNIPLLFGSRRRSVDNRDISEFTREMIRNNPLGKPLSYEDIVKSFNSGEVPRKPLTEKEVVEQLKNIDHKKVLSKKKARAPKGIWDFATKDGILKCKVDDTNKVNTYLVTSFSTKDADDFGEVVEKCAVAMDENNYPIIAITDSNGGGLITLSSILQEVIQPDMVARNMFSFKINEATKRFLNDIDDPSLNDPETCDEIGTYEKLTKGLVTDDFGNGVTHTRTKPFLSEYGALRSIMSDVKPRITKRRKPTEIIVFTDSYSFSSGSFFTKNLREAGSAIMVGYNGYPGSPAETFDIGQSPTSVLTESKAISLFNPAEYERLVAKGITFSGVSFGETFRPDDVYSGKTPLVPREFLFDAADERLPFYGPFSDDVYEEVVAAAKEIFERYKTFCNPNNPKLHMRDASCDAIINKTHMHGGYTCGEDGKWSTTCEGYYCDEGYYFDSHQKACVKDLCHDKYKDSYSSTFALNALLLLIVAVMML